MRRSGRPTCSAARRRGAHLDDDQRRLYELIWKRTVASQMESGRARPGRRRYRLGRRQVVLRATGSVVTFDGFLKLYQEDRDDPDEDEESAAACRR